MKIRESICILSIFISLILRNKLLKSSWETYDLAENKKNPSLDLIRGQRTAMSAKLGFRVCVLCVSRNIAIGVWKGFPILDDLSSLDVILWLYKHIFWFKHSCWISNGRREFETKFWIQITHSVNQVQI